MHWDALVFAAVVTAIGLSIYFWLNSKLDSIIGQLEQANDTLASILGEVEK